MSITRRSRALMVLGFFALIPRASAQGLADRLSEAKALRCVFALVATATWAKDGASQAEVKPATLTLGFDAIDVEEGTARAVDSFGPSDIIVKLSSGGTLHFVQVFNEGALYATTVFPRAAHPGKLRAVHTRHEHTDVSLPGWTSRPEQYYGECELK
jgi:hypothetical protein